MYDLCIVNYVPIVRNATAHIMLTDEEKQVLLDHLTSAVIKLVYAFVWQVK